jgi:hypothetical protein
MSKVSVNVNEDQLRQYIEIFNYTFKETANAFIPLDKRSILTLPVNWKRSYWLCLN